MKPENRPPLPDRIGVFCLDCQHTRLLAGLAARVRIDLDHEADKATFWWTCPDCLAPNADVLNLRGNRDWVAFQVLVDGGAEVCDRLAGEVMTPKHGAALTAALNATLAPHLRDAQYGDDAPAYNLMPHLEAELAAWGWTA